MKMLHEIRVQLGISQGEMAARLGVSRQCWNRLEAGAVLLNGQLGEMLEKDFGALALACDTLSFLEAREWSKTRPYAFRRVNPEPWERAWSNYGFDISRLPIEARLREWMTKLLPCDSALESFGWFQLAALSARSLLHNPHALGFRGAPIVDGRGRALGERYLPGLAGRFDRVKFLLWPQVSLRPARATFRVDGLVWARCGRKGAWAALEFDGSGHHFAKDAMRKEILRLDEIRIPEFEVTQGRAAESFCRQLRALLKA